MQKNFRYVIGIDLGTTHCAVAYSDTRDASPVPRLFPIDQLVAPGEVARLPLFASCRYHPHPEEYRPEDLVLPWNGVEQGYPEPVTPLIQGALARQLSGKTLGRSEIGRASCREECRSGWGPDLGKEKKYEELR